MEYLVLVGIVIIIYYWSSSGGKRNHRKSNTFSSSSKYTTIDHTVLPDRADTDRNIALENWRKQLKSCVATTPLTVRLKYRKSSGEYSDRIVDINGIHEKSGIIYISGYCNLRKEDRTFREDRIIQIMDFNTGEIFSSTDEFISKIQ